MEKLTLERMKSHPPQGNNVLLERSSPEHVNFLIRCYRDKAFMDLYRLSQSRAENKEEIIERLEEENSLDKEKLVKLECVIFRHKPNQEKKKPVGLVSLANYQKKHRRAEFLIGILSPKDRRAGLALEATLLVFDFAFNVLNLNKLEILVYGYNQDAQDNVLHLGFTQEGVMREHLYKNGQFIDLFVDGLLVKDFRQNKNLAKWSKRLIGRDITLLPPPSPPPPKREDASPQVLQEANISLNSEEFQKAFKNHKTKLL